MIYYLEAAIQIHDFLSLGNTVNESVKEKVNDKCNVSDVRPLYVWRPGHPTANHVHRHRTLLPRTVRHPRIRPPRRHVLHHPHHPADKPSHHHHVALGRPPLGRLPVTPQHPRCPILAPRRRFRRRRIQVPRRLRQIRRRRRHHHQRHRLWRRRWQQRRPTTRLLRSCRIQVLRVRHRRRPVRRRRHRQAVPRRAWRRRGQRRTRRRRGARAPRNGSCGRWRRRRGGDPVGGRSVPRRSSRGLGKASHVGGLEERAR